MYYICLVVFDLHCTRNLIFILGNNYNNSLIYQWKTKYVEVLITIYRGVSTIFFIWGRFYWQGTQKYFNQGQNCAKNARNFCPWDITHKKGAEYLIAAKERHQGQKHTISNFIRGICPSTSHASDYLQCFSINIRAM